MITESKELERKIAKDAKIIKWLFIALLVMLAASIAGIILSGYLLTH